MTAEEYEKHAEECDRLAAMAQLDDNRRALEASAVMWRKLAAAPLRRTDQMNQFAIDRRHGVLLVMFGGSVTPESLAAFDGEVKNFISREGSMAAIIDFTGVVSVEIDVSFAANRGKSDRLMTEKPRVYVTTNPLLCGMLRVYGAHQDSVGLRRPAVVRSLAGAFQELGLANPVFEPFAVYPREHDAANTSDANTRKVTFRR